MEICPRCGLPLQACVCEQLTKSSQRISVTTEKKRYGKVVTIIRGFDKNVDLKKITKELKNILACGGTYTEDTIELQGDHKKRIKDALVKIGFDPSLVED
ncbi:MAG: stress response translation initiation inhibitor YciH [Candidatus Pacearchaeota archaeon]|nr:MAG: stress response translation initiation inhibitor YciH [Candidatus Pacearchaeota archaeon]